MSTIIERTISGVQEKAIQMSNSCFGRPVSLPTWTKVRIALRWHCSNPSGNVLGYPQLAVGMGAGTVAMVGDMNTANWIGVTSALENWVYNWNGNNALTMGPQVRAVTKVGNLWTVGADNIFASDTGIYYPETGANRTAFMVDITKGTPNYTINVFAPSSSNGADVTDVIFYTQASQQTPVISTHAFGTARSIAFSELAGTLDTVQIMWDRTNPVIEICDLTVLKLA